MLHKRNSIFLFFFLSFILSYGQNFRAYYAVEFTPTNFDSIMNLDQIKKSVELQKIAQHMINVIQSANSKDFRLDYNQKESLFYHPPVLEKNERDFSAFGTFINFSGKYYVSKTVLTQQKEAFGKEFLVTYPKIDWKITNETKKIGKYICYKATAIKIREVPGEIIKEKIVAWFAPEIPFNYGPKDFHGLPGLIVQVQEGKTIFNLKKIVKEGDKKKIKIKPPTKGEKVTSEEYNKWVKKMFKASFPNRG